MATTGQQFCDKVRLQANDEFKREIPDAEILEYANQVTKVLYTKRPDLFIGALSAAPADIALGGNLAFSDLYVPAAIEYALSMCQRPDDEDAAARISDGAMKKFLRDIYGD